MELVRHAFWRAVHDEQSDGRFAGAGSAKPERWRRRGFAERDAVPVLVSLHPPQGSCRAESFGTGPLLFKPRRSLDAMEVRSMPTTRSTQKRSRVLSAGQKNRMQRSTFAFPKERKEPLNDARHVRNAIARFDQVGGVSDAERDAAWPILWLLGFFVRAAEGSRWYYW